ncbi:MAG: hypothetical protein KBG15_10460 [Kofleriaceae bacterium]|nr:hypothetical protein [Kofleriaceae bacterium]
MAHYRLRPRYRVLPASAASIGAVIAAFGALQGPFALVAVGGAATALGAAYWFSPTWKIRLVTSPDELQFHTARGVKSLPWTQVRKLFIDRAHRTCLIVGSNAETSVIVPGIGAPAPYDIENKSELFDEIVSYVPAARQRDVASVEEAIAAKLPWTDLDPVT